MLSIRYLTSLCGPLYTRHGGAVRPVATDIPGEQTISEAEAERLVAAGFAEYCDPGTGGPAPHPFAGCKVWRDEWADAFAVEGLDTVAALASSTPADVDGVPVQGLGPKRAEALIEWARLTLAERATNDEAGEA